MIALAFLLGASVVALSAATVTFAVFSRRDSSQLASVLVAQAHVEGEQTRLMFENDTLRDQLDLANRRADALQEVLNADANPNADLDAGELRVRLVRFAQATAAARRTGDAVVPEAATTGTSPVADVLAGLATVR